MRRIHAVAVVLVSVVFVTPAAGEVQQLYGPYFVADHAHASRLLIHNKRLDREVPLQVYALVGKGERVLVGTATLQPKESRAFELNVQLLGAAGRAEFAGGVLVEYEFFEKQPLDGSILVRKRNGSQYIIPMLRRDQIRGPVQEAVFLITSAAARAFVALQNTTTVHRSVSVDTQRTDGQRSKLEVDVEPQATRVVWLDVALAREHEAAAVRVTNPGSAGDVIAAGAVIDPNGAYAGRIRFNDLAHGEHSRTLRAQFLFLGIQEPVLGLPSGATYTSRCVVRNASDTEKIVRPRVKWLEGQQTREALLPPQRLSPHEVRVLDLAASQERGEIPLTFRSGVLEMQYEGPTGHVFAQLTSVDKPAGAFWTAR